MVETANGPDFFEQEVAVAHNFGLSRTAILVGGLVAASLGMAVSDRVKAQKAAGLEATSKNNAVIQFEGSQFTSDVGKYYRGDLNRDQQFREVFKVVLKKGEAVVFELSSKSFDSKLQILSPDNQILASDDDSGDEPQSAKLVFAAPADRAGTFYLVATSADNRGGSFLLTAAPQKAPTVATVTAIEPGKTIRAKFDRRSPLRSKEQEIYSSYSFDVEAGSRVQIEARSTGVSLRLELNQDNKIVAAGSTRSQGASLYYPAAAGGRYRIDVIAKSDSVGEFDLTMKKLPRPRSVAVLPLAIGSSVHGTFGEDSPTNSPTSNRPYALYEIAGVAGDRVAVSASVDSIEGSVGYDAVPVTLTVGADTPAGFAGVSSVMSPPQVGAVRTVVTFARPGSLLVKILGRSGAIGNFTVKAERATGIVEPAETPQY